MEKIDNTLKEKSLYEQGYEFICGTDEVGRGPLVGPVVAAAVIMPKGKYIPGVTDSKKISLKKRLELDELIRKEAIAYKITFIDNLKIDEINILEASRLAMTESILNLDVKPDFILSDAMRLDLDIPYEAVIKGDLNCYCIGCASIIAKVARDKYMEELDKLYPEFGFAKNMGYPTKTHMDAIKEFGITELHRRSYSPVKKQVDLGNFYKKK